MLIIATNKVSEQEVQQYANGRSGYVLFNYGEDADDFSSTLNSQGVEHIDLRDIIINSRPGLIKSVTGFSGALNSNPPHPGWWAVLLSRRIAMYDFSNALAKLYLIRMLIDLGKWDTIFLNDGSLSPWNYLSHGKHQIGVKFITLFSMKTEWQRRLESIFPVRTVFWFLNKIIIKTRLGLRPFEVQGTVKTRSVLIFTLISKNSFTKDTSFKDVYLGDLAKYFKAEGYTTSVLGQLHDKLTGDLLNNINSKKDNSFILLEHIWSLKDLLLVFMKALKDFIGREPEWPLSFFAGFDVKELLNVNLKWELQAGYSDNLLYYKAAKNFLEKVSPEMLIYPYENKCIERMILKAMSEVSPDTKTIGYQHAVLTPKHIHMFLAEGESDSLPLPDRIVTNGPYSARMLRETGNYPEGMITAGIALRQTAEISDDFIKKEPPQNVKNVLLTLAEGAKEYDKGLVFLRDIQKINFTGAINFRVRLHPGIQYDPFTNEKLLKDITCSKDPVSSLLESLYWADVVMYSSTSVAVQAMSMGIPVLWMDLLDFWGTDPILPDDLLRWKLSSPGEWSNVVSGIEQLPLADFHQKMNKLKQFVSDYFCQDPVDLKAWTWE